MVSARGLDVGRLRILRELDRRGTLAAVAQALAYTPSAISQQLSQLEREAGVPLLERSGRGVRLTSIAKVLAAHADGVLERLEQAESDLAAAIGGQVGTVRIALFASAAHAWAAGLLSRLAAAAPGLTVLLKVLEPELALPALVIGDLDLVVAEEYPGHPPPRWQDVTRQELRHDPFLLALPVDAPDAPDAVAAADWVLEPPGTVARAWAQTWCRSAGFEPRVRFESTDLALHLRLVAAGHAVALLPSLALGEVPAGVRLVALPAVDARRVFLAGRRGASGHPAVDRVRRALLDTVGAEWGPQPRDGAVPGVTA